MRSVYILKNRTTSNGDWEYCLISAAGETVSRFETRPKVAERYARRYGLEAIAPAFLLHLWNSAK